MKFSLKKLKNLKRGSVLIFLDGKKIKGEGEVIKLARNVGIAKIYKGKGIVQRGNQVLLLKKFTGADKKKYIKRKWAAFGGIGHNSLGSFFTGRTNDPTSFDSYFGFKVELNYKFNNKFAALVGIDKYGASKAVNIPEEAFVSGATKVNGEISDIYIAGQYFFQKHPFINTFIALGFVPRTGHKVGQSFSGIKYEFVYTGIGFLIRGGKEWVFKRNWIISLNLDFRSYSLTTFEDHNSATEYPLDASLTSFSSGVLFGRTF